MLSFLPLLFIPAMTGVINYPSLFSASGAALFLIIVLSTIVTMIAAGYASQLLEHKANQRKEKRSAANMYRNPYNFVHGRRLSGYGEIICALSISLSHTGFDDYDFHYRRAACFHISYKDYMIGGQWINSLLGPAVVALAYPLYKQRRVLIKYMFPIIGGVLAGLFSGMVSGLLFAELFGISRSLILSIIPKSITTPVAIQIASGIGGVPSMTVVFVMIAGFSGVILGPLLLKWIRIRSSLGKGIAFGSASHALGTSKAMEYGELTVSMSSVSMTLCAVLGSVFGPVVAWMFQI